MGYVIEGDGTKLGTTISKDGNIIDWDTCVVDIDQSQCIAYVDTVPYHLDRIVLLGIYQIIGDGDYTNTRLVINDSVFRGVTSLTFSTGFRKPPLLTVKSVFLPNIIEGEESADN